MTANQSAPGILVIYPPQIPGATTPVISDPPSDPGTALIGLPQSIFTQTATRDGALAAAVKVRIDPPTHDGKGYDAISLWLDGDMLESKPIPPSDWNEVTFFDLFESLLRDGRINTLTYKIHRASENTSESEPLLILYSRELPGGNDVPGTGDHPRLEISLPAELGDPPHIGKDEVDKGVPVTLFYPFMKAYDKITLELNRERFTFTLQSGEEGKPYVITLTRAMFEQASSHPQFPISYTVVDQLNNPTYERRWSRNIMADVDLERVTLTAPDLSENPDDPTDDPDTIDLGKLKDFLYVMVHVFSPLWVAGDTVRVSYTCTPPTGPVVTHTAEVTVGRLPFTHKLEVPAAKVLPDSQVQAIYEQVRDGKVIGTSKPATARVIGEGVPNQLPPTVQVSDGTTLDPARNPDGANARIEFLAARPTDTAQLVVSGDPGIGSPTFSARPFNANKRVNFALTRAFIEANHGKKVQFSWILHRDGKQTPSPSLELTVLELLTALAFINEPYVIAPMGQLKDIQLLVSREGKPVPDETVTLSLPTGFNYPDGGSGLRDFIAGPDGIATVSGVKGSTHTGTKSLTATSAGQTATSVVTITSQGPTGTIPVTSNSSMGIAYSPDGTRIYVCHYDTHTVSVIDTLKMQVIAIIGVGQHPYSIACSLDGNHVYVCNNTSDYVSVIDTASLSVINNIAVGHRPLSVAFSPNGNRAFVTVQSEGKVAVIDTQSMVVVEKIPVDSSLWYIALSASGAYAYISNRIQSGTISVIDTASRKVIKRLSTGQGHPEKIATSPDARAYFTSTYIGSNNSSSVSVMDSQSGEIIKVFSIAGHQITGAALHPATSRFYTTYRIGNNDWSFIWIMDTQKLEVISTYRIEGMGQEIAISPDGKRLCVSYYGRNFVSIIAIG